MATINTVNQQALTTTRPSLALAPNRQETGAHRVFSLVQPGRFYGETPIVEVHTNSPATAKRIHDLADKFIIAKKDFNIADGKRSNELTKIWTPFVKGSFFEWLKLRGISKECYQVLKNKVEDLTREVQSQGNKVALIDPRTGEQIQHNKLEEYLLSPLTMKFN